MSESERRGDESDPKAALLLALHAEHRDGLHITPRFECIQCTFDSLVRHDGDGTEPLGELGPT